MQGTAAGQGRHHLHSTRSMLLMLSEGYSDFDWFWAGLVYLGEGVDVVIDQENHRPRRICRRRT